MFGIIVSIKELFGVLQLLRSEDQILFSTSDGNRDVAIGGEMHQKDLIMMYMIHPCCLLTCSPQNLFIIVFTSKSYCIYEVVNGQKENRIKWIDQEGIEVILLFLYFSFHTSEVLSQMNLISYLTFFFHRWRSQFCCEANHQRDACRGFTAHDTRGNIIL